MSQNGQELGNAARITGLVGQIGCVTGIVSIIIIAIAFAIGWFLDSQLGTNGILIVLFLVAFFATETTVGNTDTLDNTRRSQRPQTASIDKEIESSSEEETEKS